MRIILDNGANQKQIRIKYKLELLPSSMIGNVLKDLLRYFLPRDFEIFLTGAARKFSELSERVSSENRFRTSLKSTSSSRGSTTARLSLVSLPVSFFSVDLLE